MIDALTPELGVLAAVVLLASAVQTAIGFGAMLVCVTLGSFLWSVPELTAMLVPLTWLQSAYIVARYRHDIQWRQLLAWILPWMGLGMLTSLALVGGEAQPWMKPALGVGVLALALRELVLAWRPAPAPRAAPSGHTLASTIALVVAGLVHGVFATGGPPLVWALGQEHLSKAAFRSTLTAVWVAVNTVLLTAFALRGQLDGTTLTRTAWLVVPLGLGVVVGDWLHHRVDESRFRLAVWGLLALAAIPLLGG